MNRAERRQSEKSSRSSPPRRRIGHLALDPVNYALCGTRPMPACRQAELTGAAEQWFDALRAGRATYDDILGFYGVAHLVATLGSLGSRGKLGYELSDPEAPARVIMAIDRLCSAAPALGGRYVCRAQDLADIRELLETHRALLEVALQIDLERASKLMVARMRSRGILPSVLKGCHS